MKKFEPSRHFVPKVMQEVRAYEETTTSVFGRSQILLASPFARYALSAAGILAGIANLVRITMTVFSPAVCR